MLEMLEGLKLVKNYRMGSVEVRALNSVDVSVKTGEFVCLIGPSGSGKTTLIHILGLIERPSSGAVFLYGEQISNSHSVWRYRGRKIAIVFQFFNLLPRLTVLENTALPLLVRGIPSAEAYEQATKALAQVGLQEKGSFKPYELSGGEQQRVAIARALASGAEYVLADEPTGNLDTENGNKVIQHLFDLSRQGKGVLVATHNQEYTKRADRVIRLRDGKVVEG